MRPSRFLPLALIVLPLLTGCETVSETLGFSTGKELVDPGPGCPRVGMLPAATKMTAYRPGAGRDLTDVLHEIELTRLSGDCIPDKKGKEVGVELNVHFTAARGPADTVRRADFVYVVAVVDAANQVQARREFPARAEFPSNLNRITFRDELRQRIPLDGKPGSAYQILVGLKLDRDQLDRARRGQ